MPLGVNDFKWVVRLNSWIIFFINKLLIYFV